MSVYDVGAYEVLEKREIKDVKSMGYILRHKKSGARVTILSNDDDNKVFYIAFRTPPQDETGVPHIIEHTTLCGSEKFPVKDPFVELVKGSLNTFLNAMTYPDKTMYPIASYNEQDFKNLMDVYLDAVFHPNITRYQEIFKQEGWHYELENADAPITINGVVYNEMKGAYSSPDEVLQNVIFQSLFPDNTYSRNAGGNPLHIPELTYEDYLAFYRKYYHPANSYIYLYGDMDVEERLKWMDEEYLSHFDSAEVDSEIPLQKPFTQIKEMEDSYSIASDDPEENRTYLAYNRVVGTTMDAMLYHAFDVLKYALVSAPGAPVRQALIDAGIGEDVYGSYEGAVLQPVFSIVAKNANVSDKERFLLIIEETLQKIVKDGINTDALLGAINSSEFLFREADFGQFPKGLMYGIACMDSWLFDDMHPFLHLECLDIYKELKNRINTGYFENLVKEYLLDNTHGSTIVVSPCRGKNTQEDAVLKAQLEEYKATLSKEELQQLIDDTISLKEYQDTPSSDEELEKIPMLTRADMKREAMPFQNEVRMMDGLSVVLHDVDTNGIDYVNLLFDASDVKVDDIGYMGLLSCVLGEMDTEEHSYADLANVINIYTGGISGGATIYPNVKQKDKLAVRFEIRIRVLEEALEKAMQLSDEILRTTKFGDVKRLTEIVAQTKARLQVNLSSSGHTVAFTRALSYQSAYAFYQDALRGVAYYRFICEVEKMLNSNPNEVVENLQRISQKLFAQNRLQISFTGSAFAFASAEPILTKYLKKLEAESRMQEIPELSLTKKNEGLIDASQIQYVARTGNFINHGFSYSGVLRILKLVMGYDYLWMNVRVKGGAYGCMSSFLRTGEAYFVSYRDPNLRKTNEIYDAIPEYLRNFDPNERDMTKYIIGTFGSLDTPLNPDAKGSRSMAAYLEELTYEDIQKERDEILNAQASDIRALADLVEAVLKDQCICVIGNENMIKDAADMFDTTEKLYM